MLQQKRMLHAQSQTQKATHCMIPPIWNAQKRLIYKDWKHIDGGLGLSGGADKN